MTTDDRGCCAVCEAQAGSPAEDPRLVAAHIDAVARHLPMLVPWERLTEGCRKDFRLKAQRILDDPAVLDALAWAVTRTPEGRDRVLAALVETGTLSPRFGVLSFANRQIVPTDSESGAGYAASRLKGAKMRRLVTEWTEVEP